MLLDAGANTALRNKDGFTAAQLADQYEKNEFKTLLLKHRQQPQAASRSAARSAVAAAPRQQQTNSRNTNTNKNAKAAASPGAGAGGLSSGCASFEEKWAAATVFEGPSASPTPEHRAVVLAMPPCPPS
jgi:hypothetical protein